MDSAVAGITDAAAEIGRTMSIVYLAGGICACACFGGVGAYLAIANPPARDGDGKEISSRPLGLVFIAIGVCVLGLAVLRYVLTRQSKAFAAMTGASNATGFISSAMRPGAPPVQRPAWRPRAPTTGGGGLRRR